MIWFAILFNTISVIALVCVIVTHTQRLNLQNRILDEFCNWFEVVFEELEELEHEHTTDKSRNGNSETNSKIQ